MRHHLETIFCDSLEHAYAHMPAVLDWMARFGERLRLAGYPTTLDVAGPRHLSMSSWKRLRSRLLNRDLKVLMVSTDFNVVSPKIAVRVGFFIGMGLPDESERTDLRLDLFVGSPPDATPIIPENAFVDLSLELAELSGLRNGVAGRKPDHPDSPQKTAEELALGLYSLSGDDYSRVVRGVLWGTWLTTGHLERLGGRDTVKNTAPVEIVRDLPSGLWLQLTEDSRTATVEQFSELRRFLAPVLLSGTQQLETQPKRMALPELRVGVFGDRDRWDRARVVMPREQRERRPIVLEILMQQFAPKFPNVKVEGNLQDERAIVLRVTGGLPPEAMADELSRAVADAAHGRSLVGTRIELSLADDEQAPPSSGSSGSS